MAVRDGRRLAEIAASRVVLSAGAYGSPAILLRSGIGPAGELSAIGARPVLDLPGVGRNLHDQPCLNVACLTPLSGGHVRLTGPGLRDKLVIDHRYLSDPGGSDRARLAEGVERVREVAVVPELRKPLAAEIRPGPEISSRTAIERFIDNTRWDRQATRTRSLTPTAGCTGSTVSTWRTRR